MTATQAEARPTGAFAPRTVLVTGGAGFIGSNLVRWLLSHVPTLQVVTLDALTYAGNLESLRDVAAAHGPAGDGRHYFVHGDVRDGALLATLLRGGGAEPVTGRELPMPDAVFHLAAETHVDRSILGPAEFVSTNVQGTLTLLQAVDAELQRAARPFRVVNVGTDEVYGTLAFGEPPFTEEHPLRPNSPYSASKAGADCLVRAYVETFGLPCVTTRCSNNYGPYQFPEKLIPLMVTRALAGEALPVYGTGRNVRDWLHVDDHASALWAACTRGRVGEVYNVGGRAERANLDVVREILRIVGRPESLITFVPDRRGHDLRYAIDCDKLATETGWAPGVTFERGLAETVRWYVDSRWWWEGVLSEAYRTARQLYLAEALA